MVNPSANSPARHGLSASRRSNSRRVESASAPMVASIRIEQLCNPTVTYMSSGTLRSGVRKTDCIELVWARGGISMFTISSSRPAVWMLVALFTVGTAILTHDVAAAADLASAPDAHKFGSPVALKIRPDKHDFGQVIVPLVSAPRTVNVRNNSKSASVEFTTVVAAPPFSIQTDGCSGSPLAAGASCEVAVLFHPTTTGKVKNKKALTFTDS